MSSDPSQSQREIYNGRFTLSFSSKMPLKMQILKYAGEEIAFHLHKKRDFLLRLDKHKILSANKSDESLFFQKLLGALAEEDEALRKSLSKDADYREHVGAVPQSPSKKLAPKRRSKEEEVMEDEELRKLLLDTISKIRKYNQIEKQVSQKKFERKMKQKM